MDTRSQHVLGMDEIVDTLAETHQVNGVYKSCRRADAHLRNFFLNMRKILTFERKKGKTGTFNDFGII